MTYADYLRAAADRLLTQGWTQRIYGSYEDDDGAVCAVGALYAAGGGQFENRLDKDISRRTGSQWGSTAGWNDDPSRTRAQVVRMLLAIAQDNTK